MTETDPPSSGPRVRSRWPGRLLRTTLVIACLAYALWNVDPTSLLETLADIEATWAAEQAAFVTDRQDWLLYP